jgi:hypothetical protein
MAITAEDLLSEIETERDRLSKQHLAKTIIDVVFNLLLATMIVIACVIAFSGRFGFFR